MENASKALIIAGAVLLAILILSIGVYLVNSFRGASDSYVSQLDATELSKYNSNFEVFVGRKDITAQELVTLINLTQQQERKTQIFLIERNTNIEISEYNEDKKNDILENNLLIYSIDPNTNEEVVDNLYEFNAIEYDSEGRVSKITFKN